ncbi:F-box protein At4g00755-like [Olea europaea var. sylvestris]|uniref:F-box protein At4g00755-like n=1 Tax=Olea europaea var. sylvestris TaxID=158386 RepID=UPI000C1D6F87|nr:F-box protein At4g00755-like [Olea europaea var. sylvestris]
MEAGSDFIQYLGSDMSIKILTSLNDPSDLVRVSAVSLSWRQFVIANGLSKQLCVRTCPEVSSFANIVEVKNTIEPLDNGKEDSSEWVCLERDHRVYAFLTRSLTLFTWKDCISDAIVASSTDNYPQESIKNTLESSDRVDQRASYWSSKGASNPAVPETLTYKLAARLCMITEVHVQPFLAYFQFGFPIYSAKAVRFRMGHPKDLMEVENVDTDEFPAHQESAGDKFLWTYTSPEFPMAQENRLQKFKLPEPVLCIGGILQVELLGRVQTQQMDGLYYICIGHVQAVGRPLSPAFDIKMMAESGKCTLEYNPEAAAHYLSLAKHPEIEPNCRPQFHRFSASIRGWEQMILNSLLRAGPMVLDPDFDSDDDEFLA